MNSTETEKYHSAHYTVRVNRVEAALPPSAPGRPVSADRRKIPYA